MKIERPKTGYQTMNLKEGGKLKTYHNLGSAMWGEQLWHEGEWAIYRPIAFGEGATHAYPTSSYGYNCVLVHSRVWEEKSVIHKTTEPTRFRMCGDEAAVQGYYETEATEMVCHTHLYPVSYVSCHSCRAKIPEGAIAMWKMLNWERLSEEQ